MDLKHYRIDPEKEAKGVWIDDGDGGRLLIASGTNGKYKKALRKRLGAVPSHILKANPALQEKIIGEVLAEHVLLSWEGITNDGETFEPTLENRKRAMCMEHFREFVAGHSMDISHFQSEGDTEDADAVKTGA